MAMFRRKYFEMLILPFWMKGDPLQLHGLRALDIRRDFQRLLSAGQGEGSRGVGFENPVAAGGHDLSCELLRAHADHIFRGGVWSAALA